MLFITRVTEKSKYSYIKIYISSLYKKEDLLILFNIKIFFYSVKELLL
jgi:hypothetical protein